jgi:hypothetical protein
MTPTKGGERKWFYLVFQLITTEKVSLASLDLSSHKKKQQREENWQKAGGKTLCKGKKQREMAPFWLMYKPCGSEKTASHISRGKKRMITLFWIRREGEKKSLTHQFKALAKRLNVLFGDRRMKWEFKVNDGAVKLLLRVIESWKNGRKILKGKL